MTPHHRRSTCRGCGGVDLECVLELGPQPLANSFLDSPDDFSGESSYPLDLFVCGDCFLVQLVDVIDPEVLFRDYVYVSGTSETMNRHFAAYAQHVMALQDYGPSDLVVEVASNDGSLIRHFRDAGSRVLGIEPAKNIAELAVAQGLETIAEFLDQETANEVRSRYGPAKTVIANNVFAHVDDPSGFLRACHTIVGDDGLVIIEAPSLVDMLERLEYDTIYHEHLCYLSATALVPLFERAGLSVVRMEHHQVHGGSLRTYARKRTDGVEHSQSVLDRVREESDAGLRDMSTYHGFGDAVESGRSELLETLASYKGDGRRLAGYGAPAKGNTLLNYCGIGPETIDYIVDRNPLKTGRFTPGTHIPVHDVDRLEAEPPDALLILAWNYADEIIEQLDWLKRRGVDFIVPVPHPRVR